MTNARKDVTTSVDVTEAFFGSESSGWSDTI